MPDPTFILLYVESVPDSVAFYEALLGRPPAEASPGFAMFALRSGVMLGLWKRAGVQPVPEVAPGSAELAITVADADAVRATHADWAARGIPILQAPTAMDFGETFTARDPDGHRIRVFAPVPA